MNKYSFDYMNDNPSKFINRLEKELAGVNGDVTILCIGTDSVVYDSLGPLVGTMLLERGVGYMGGVKVVGHLGSLVHAKNLEERICEISEDSFVIAVDAVLGDLSKLYQVSLWAGGLKPGKGVGKDLPVVGDISIVGHVATSALAAAMPLGNLVRLNVVYDMARFISSTLYTVLETKNIRLRSIY